ncbi:GNAT acetyltransferase-like protein [Kineothrix alysoides]|uniref:GNAT acetyltransferase-like protein n=1 Tax=Kineothrix alysoides TaxID=1469948 RepID=A0A4R1R6F7_9FIRM|nr:GNAT family N-acetyltransferase [Kineothrix alysoides]TCL61049.1 GNAT acetyltransferase-like protein [Kineothrix alysoides]
MYEVSSKDMSKIAPLFQNASHTIIWSCLQGYMGRAWTDDLEHPSSAQIVVGDFCFFAGAPDRELAANIHVDSPSGLLLLIPESPGWGVLIEETYPESFERFMRYSIKKEPEAFHKETLSGNIADLPDGYSLHRIDEAIYRRLLKLDQLRDLCSVFSSYKAYERHGLGFVVMCEDTIVSGASSYTVYDKGIEIEVDTLPEYRRKGLAFICASRLILECLEKGLYPSWDAMNKESVTLAERLGYHLGDEYVTYIVIEKS